MRQLTRGCFKAGKSQKISHADAQHLPALEPFQNVEFPGMRLEWFDALPRRGKELLFCLGLVENVGCGQPSKQLRVANEDVRKILRHAEDQHQSFE